MPDPSRVAIVRALGNVLEQQSAAYLIQLLQDPTNSDSVHKAAAEALGEMTGLQDYGPDLQRWLQWWKDNQNKTPDQWRADLLASRAREDNRLKQHYAQLSSNTRQLVRRLYSATPDDKKEDMLVSYLTDSSSPENRMAGAQLVTDDFEDNRPISPAVKQHLRQLIGDSDRDVRDAVIEALGNINDQEAAPVLIAQLSRETDSQIRVKIASALGRMNNLAAVPALLDMLDSSYYREASAAADALARLGEQLRTTNPALARQATDKLQKILDTKSTDPSAGDLRANCVRALAEMGDARSLNTFIHLTQARRKRRRSHRRAAWPRGIEKSRRRCDDHRRSERSQARGAIGRRPGSGARRWICASRIPVRNARARNRPARARAAVWVDLQKIFKTGSVEDLAPWPDRFKNDPEKRLVALRAFRDALVTANKNQDAALVEQDIGETLMNLTPKRAAEAVDSFQKAMNYWSQEGKNQAGVDAALDGLVGDMLDALLYLKKYPEAADFSAAQIKISSAYVPTVGAKLKIEAQQLEKSGDNDDAKNLINAALKISWPPESHYQIDLKQTLDEINSRAATPTPKAGQ